MTKLEKAVIVFLILALGWAGKRQMKLIEAGAEKLTKGNESIISLTEDPA